MYSPKFTFGPFGGNREADVTTGENEYGTSALEVASPLLGSLKKPSSDPLP